MAKRLRADVEVDGDADRVSKRTKSSTPDRLSRLSDELLVKVLSCLSIPQLVVCQRVSAKFRKLANDSQIWKSHYYRRFVRPRASRLPSLKEVGIVHESLHFASRSSRWLDDEHLIEKGGRTDWKMQYKLRHNRPEWIQRPFASEGIPYNRRPTANVTMPGWLGGLCGQFLNALRIHLDAVYEGELRFAWSRGLCAVNEIPVATQAAIPPVLVEMCDGIVFTADQSDGLRAFSAKEDRQMVAQLPFPKLRMPRPPTALTIDATSNSGVGSVKLVVGFEDGSFSVYQLLQDGGELVHRYTHESSSNGVISAAAVSWPYVATMTATQLLSVYAFRNTEQNMLDAPRLLHSLKSHTVWPPLCISLRASTSAILTSIAYALPTYLSGWTVGIQEVKLSPDGLLLSSRITSAIDQHYRPLAFSSRPMIQHLAPFSSSSTSPPLAFEIKHIHSKPTSLSYAHPYLLASHPDNTLTLYLVTSTADALSISAGSRLWGHTSAVSGASVGSRGKAVSVSRRGDELRIWELEGGFGSTAARKRLASGDLSVQIKPGSRNTRTAKPRIEEIGIDSEDSEEELMQTRGWVGFDDEKVVLLKEENQGKQTLVVYDFT